MARTLERGFDLGLLPVLFVLFLMAVANFFTVELALSVAGR
jgi:hypothetical protein